MLFIITQEPKRGKREGYVVKVTVVQAETKREALELSGRHFEDDSGIFKKPQAERLTIGQCYRL